MRIWLNVNKKQQHLLFCNSDHYITFQHDNPGATVGYDVWSDVLSSVGSFVKMPLPESCVDERMSALEHFMAAILEVLKRKDVKEELGKYKPTGNHLTYKETYECTRKAGGYQMIETMCCPVEDQPELKLDESKKCPKLIPFRCTHGTYGKGSERCTCCGVSKKLGILDELNKLEAAQELVEVMVWQDSERQGTKKGKGGKVTQNTQRELDRQEMTVSELIKKFKDQIEICTPHYQEICWIRTIMGIDFSQLPPGTLLILTDFASVMALRALQTKNSSVG